MRKKRNFGLSRLKMAWIALILVIGAGALTAWVLPEREIQPDLAIELPRVPERYATGPADDLPVMPEADQEAESASGPPGTTKEPVAANDLSRLPDTEEEELADGTLRITIPTSQTADVTTAGGMRKKAVPALVEEGEFGTSPRMGADGKTPFNVYSRTVRPSGSPEVAIMLSGLGLDPVLTEQAIERLPPEVSMSFAPYSKNVTVLMEKAMAAGHEVAIELPMEEPGVSAEALGPAGLTIARQGEGNARRLDWLFARSPAYPMATNYLGSSFGKDPAAMTQVMAALRARGLGYIDDTGLGAEAAAGLGVPYGRVNVVVPRGSGLAGQGLVQLKGAASKGRPVLGRLYISPDAITAIEKWSEEIKAEGYVLVPASAVAKRQS